MITFQDGPAKEIAFELTRAPVMLRVVHSESNDKWDALDRLDDVPAEDEAIHIYRLVFEPSTYFIDYRDRKTRRRRGRQGVRALYSLYPDPPGDATARDNEQWAAWCEGNRKAILKDRPYTV